MKRFFISIVFILFVINNGYSQNPSEPKIGTLDGKQFICIDQPKPIIKVKIEVPVGYSKVIDRFVIEWFLIGSGTIRSITVPASYNPPIQNLEFDLSSFFNSCEDSVRADITVYTYIVNESEPVNNGFKPTFRQPPTAKINRDSLVTCVNQTFTFDGSNSCPRNVSDFEWTIEGQKYFGKTIPHVFLTPGMKNVKLKVTNQCGTDEDEITINVRQLPVANANADANLVSNVYEICLNDKEKGAIIVDGLNSRDAEKYEWFVLDSASSYYDIQEVFPLLPPNQKIKRIVFFRKGTYKIVLKVSMPCNYPDYDTITVRVLDREPVFLTPISDTCGPIQYSPPANISGSLYFINNRPQPSFPVTLVAGNYKIKVTYENKCGPTADSISFKVIEPVDTRITLPSKDTTVCKGSGRFKIAGSPNGGSFTSSPHIQSDLNGTYFTPTTTGVHTITYNTGFGNCLRSASVKVTVVDAVVLTINPQPDVCNSVSYTPSPLVANAVYKINGTTISSFPYLINTPGNYITTATLSNECGLAEVRDTFKLITPNVVNILTPSKDTTICADSPEFEIKVNIAGGSFSPTGKVIERNGKYFFKPTVTESFDLRYDFGFGACASSSTRKITVISGVPLSLNPQPDVCNTINYKPEPFNNQATYKINGQVVPNTEFPKSYSTAGVYIVEAFLKNECGQKTIRDTFEVTIPQDVRFITPSSDTILCKGNPEFEVKVSVPGGTMTTVPGLSERGGKYFFNPAQTGTFTLSYKQGIGSCERNATVKITVVEGVPLSLNPQPDVCDTITYKPEPFNNQATYIINGQIVPNTEFPKSYSTAGVYTVEAFLKNECGQKTISDTFEVTIPQDVRFTTPSSDTVLCKGDPEFEVKVSVPGGTMATVPGLTESGGKYFFNPAQTGEFILSYKQGIGDCERNASVKITVVEGVPLSLDRQPDACNTISYRPEPFNNLATYKINGQVVPNTEFPKSYSAAGKYTVEAFLKNECGEITLLDTFKLTVPNNVKILSPASDIAICTSNNPLEIIGSFAGGSFNNLPQLETRGDSAYLDISVAGEYVIIYSEGFGDCFTSDTITIKVEDSKVLTLDQQEDACEPLEYQITPFNSFANYSINGQPYDGQSIQLTQGVYTVKAILTDVCSTKEDSTTFSVYGSDQLYIIGSGDTQICVNSNPLQLSPSLINATISGDHIELVNNIYSFTPRDPGVFVIYATLDLSTCTLTDSIIIEVIGLAPEIDDIRLCYGTSEIVLSGSPSGGIWGSSTCPDCITGNVFNLNKLNGFESDYYYTITNDIGCVATDTARILLLNPVSNFSISGPACASGVNIDSSNSVSDKNLWLIDGLDYGYPPFVGLSNGSHVITMITNIEQCFDTLSIDVFIINPPATSADFDLKSKEGCSPYLLDVSANNPSLDYLKYRWILNYADSTYVFDTFNFPGFNLVNNTPFREKAVLSLMAFNDCDTLQTTDSLFVIGNPLAEIGIDSNRTGCSPYIVLFSNRSLGEIDSCVWEINGKTISTCDPFIIQTLTAKDSITKYPVILTVYNECSTSSYSDTITVIPPGIRAFFNTDDYSICAGIPVRFEDASTPKPNEWYWSFGDGTISTEQNPDHTYTESGKDFQVTLFVSNGCGFDSLSRTINTGNTPDVDFIVPIYGCQNQVVDSIIQLSYKNGQRFIWDFGNNIKDSTKINPKPIYDTPGLYNVTLTVYDRGFECPGILEKDFEIKTQPSANFLLDSIICYGKELVVPNTTTDANNYVWLYDNVPIQGTEDPIIIFNQTGEHVITLIASYNDRCVDSIRKVVFVRRCDVYIPNLFTPNNDGQNDFFTAYGGVNVSLIRKVLIYDRWGDLVFEKKNIAPNVDYYGWDGSVSTRSKSYGLSSSVFVYVIDIEFVDGEVVTFSGDVTLLR